MVSKPVICKISPCGGFSQIASHMTPGLTTEMEEDRKSSNNISRDLRNITWPIGYRKALTIPGDNSRHEGATDRACKSLILLSEEICLTGLLTGSCRCSPHQEVKSFHFKAYSFLMDGDLE